MASWWQRGLIYQVYPRSFQDADGDGVGDLRGVIDRLDYLAGLRIDALWLSPVYPSPMKDFGYDVANYVDIDPLFGTLADFDALLDHTHRRGLKLILDYVPNHTSDEHPWFIDARSSRESRHREWYLWRDPGPDGGPPNNWLSHFGGSGWELDPNSGQYYYHSFLPGQPDLNWRNPQVRAAMHEVLRFWLKRGVDGFRVDVLWLLIKDDQFRDNPPNPAWHPGDSPASSQIMLYTADRPEVQQVVADLRRVCDEFEDRVLIGEIYLPLERLVAYYGAELSGAQLPFNFQLLQARWNARSLATLIADYEAALPPGAWPNWVLGNHDRPRIASRVGIDQARVAAMLLLTLRGTPTLYYGDELGMFDVDIPPALVQDPFEKRVPGMGLGRDPCRTPMQWNGSAQAGFTAGRPWLPLDPDYAVVNVEAQRRDPTSMLTLYHRLIELRRSSSALTLGAYQPLAMTGDLLAYIRQSDTQRFLIALNLGGDPHAVAIPYAGTLVLSTYLDRGAEAINSELHLRGNEGIVVALD